MFPNPGDVYRAGVLRPVVAVVHETVRPSCDAAHDIADPAPATAVPPCSWWWRTPRRRCGGKRRVAERAADYTHVGSVGHGKQIGATASNLHPTKIGLPPVPWADLVVTGILPLLMSRMPSPRMIRITWSRSAFWESQSCAISWVHPDVSVPRKSRSRRRNLVHPAQFRVLRPQLFEFGHRVSGRLF